MSDRLGADRKTTAIREALQDGAGVGDARYVYPKAWEAVDALAARLVQVEAALEAAERLVAVSSWDSIEQAEDLRVALAVLRVGRNDE